MQYKKLGILAIIGYLAWIVHVAEPALAYYALRNPDATFQQIVDYFLKSHPQSSTLWGQRLP